LAGSTHAKVSGIAFLIRSRSGLLAYAMSLSAARTEGLACWLASFLFELSCKKNRGQ
jgi:hypothetical protein